MWLPRDLSDFRQRYGSDRNAGRRFDRFTRRANLRPSKLIVSLRCKRLEKFWQPLGGWGDINVTDLPDYPGVALRLVSLQNCTRGRAEFETNTSPGIRPGKEAGAEIRDRLGTLLLGVDHN